MHPKQAFTEITIQRLLRIIAAHEKSEPLRIKIYNADHLPTSIRERQLIVRYQQNPFLQISRWP